MSTLHARPPAVRSSLPDARSAAPSAKRTSPRGMVLGHSWSTALWIVLGTRTPVSAPETGECGRWRGRHCHHDTTTTQRSLRGLPGRVQFEKPAIQRKPRCCQAAQRRLLSNPDHCSSIGPAVMLLPVPRMRKSGPPILARRGVQRLTYVSPPGGARKRELLRRSGLGDEPWTWPPARPGRRDGMGGPERLGPASPPTATGHHRSADELIAGQILPCPGLSDGLGASIRILRRCRCGARPPPSPALWPTCCRSRCVAGSGRSRRSR
jgi:hypothetical protein